MPVFCKESCVWEVVSIRVDERDLGYAARLAGRVGKGMFCCYEMWPTFIFYSLTLVYLLM